VRKFHRLQEFILVWAGDEAKPIMFDGELFVMPPHDEKAEAGPGSPYRYEGVRDALGHMLPGTIAVKDRVETNAQGGYVKRFDVVEFCTWLEDNREDLFAQGFAIVESTDEVEAALASGRPKYQRSQDEYARAVLQQELERRKKWETKGIPAPQSSSEHKIRWAAQHLENRARVAPSISDDAIRRVLGGVSAAPAPERVNAPVVSDGEPREMGDEKRLDEHTPGDLFEMAEASGITLTKAEMGKLLRNDLEFRGALLEQIAKKQEGVPA
jgi:hypothetical protein